MVIAVFEKDSDYTRTCGLWQWDYGQVLRIQGLDLPTATEIHFSLQEQNGESVTRIGVTRDGVTDVTIPDSMLENVSGRSDTYNIYVFIYLSDGTSGETVKKAILTVRRRPKPEAFNTPDDEELFRETIQIVNDAAERAEQSAESAKASEESATESERKVQEDRKEVERLVQSAEHIDEDVKLVRQYKESAEQSATQAKQSEQNAKASENAAEIAQAGAKKAQQETQILHDNVEENTSSVEELTKQAEQHEQGAREALEQTEQTAEKALTDIESARQSTLQDITNEGIAQIEAVETEGQEQLEAISLAGQNQVSAVNQTGSTQVQNVNTAGTTQVSNINSAGTEQISGIEQKGQEVLDSIPEDYQTGLASKVDKAQGVENSGKFLGIGEDGNVKVTEIRQFTEEQEQRLDDAVSDIYDLYRTKGSAIVQKSEGTALLVKDSAEAPLHGLKLFGKSVQDTTTGAQLLNIPDDYIGETNGVTWSANGGVIHVSGTAISDVFTTNVDITDLIEPGQDYYISDNINGMPIFAYLEAYYTDETPNDYSQNNVYTAKPNIEKVIFYINVSAGATVDADVYPMLNAGSTALPWEPYTGDQPSPSPDYPQEITSAGDDGSIQVDVTGTQLFDISKATPFAIAFGLETTVDGEYITLQGVSTRTGLSQFRLININQPYFDAVWKITDVEEEVGATVAHLQAPKNDGVNFTGALTIICTLNEGVEVKLRFKIMASKSGSTTWEPYKQPQTITIQTPNGLPGIPVSSGGNYTDESGQQWICDEIDFKRGKYVRRIGKHVFNADDISNSIVTSYNECDVLLFEILGMKSLQGYMNTFCNKYGAFSGTWSTGLNKMSLNYSYAYFGVPKGHKNIASNTEVYYPLNTPIETDLTQEQMEAYANMYTNRPTTAISNDSDAYMEVDYAADTKTYIDNKIQETLQSLAETQIQLLKEE